MSKKPRTYKIVERLPTEQEYWKLAKATGYSKLIQKSCVSTALRNSLFGVVALDDEQVVGTGRIVGDGAIFFYIQDLMVSPKYQKQGIGRSLLDGLMQYINEHAQWPCFVSLFTSKGLARLFTPYGFQGPETFLYGMSVGKSVDEAIPLAGETKETT